MWISPSRTHVAGRRGPRQVCNYCFSPIECGQRYHRRVERVTKRGRRHLFVSIEHANPSECPIFDHEPYLTHSGTEVSVAYEMVYVARQVEVLNVDGKSFTETEFVLEPRPVTMTEVKPESYDCDYDEEIPF